MSKTITPEMIEALGHLREFAVRNRSNTTVTGSGPAARAFDLLDNEDFFAAIDDETNNG